ncbi:MAG: hypothetical protein LBR67_11240 [Dysgonamonadaceae bacterium]|jgi:hypothetical protein|nr:hypothetical protein [Dysgonamonadaceae bacterium]
MKNQIKLFDAIKSRIGNAQLVIQVAKCLEVSEDAAYRRIRGDKELSFTEIKKLSENFNVSFDTLMNINSPYRSLPYTFYNQDYFNMEDMDFRMSGDYLTAIREALKHSYSEFGFSTNTLTLHTRIFFQPIFRFFVLKWMYQFGGPDKVKPFSKIKPPALLIDHHTQYNDLVKKATYTFIIFQESAIHSVIHDIKYFYDIHILTDADLAELKDTLATMLNYMEELTANGQFEDGGKIDFYSSGINMEASYSYLYSENVTISMIDAFTVGALSSTNPGTVKMMKDWMSSLKRASTLLTGSERNKIAFFDKQWEYLKIL